MKGKSLGEKDNSAEMEGEKRKPVLPGSKDFQYLSKEGLVFASVMVFLILIFVFYIPGLKKFWTADDNNFLAYSMIVTIIFTIFLILGGFVLYKSGLWSIKNESKGFGTFAFGAILLFMIPFGSSAGFLPGDADWMGPIHIILLVLGILICLAGMVLLAREGGFFTVWFFGTAFFWLYGFHEGFKFLIHNGQFGMYDQFLSYEAIGIMLASLVLYFYSELKFIYLAYLVDEALKLSKEKEYEGSIEILDKALTIYPNYVTALNNKGNVLYRQKSYNLSRECYLQVIEIEPDYGKAKSNLKLANKKLGIKDAV